MKIQQDETMIRSSSLSDTDLKKYADEHIQY